jgi:hypothetical protein
VRGLSRLTSLGALGLLCAALAGCSGSGGKDASGAASTTTSTTTAVPTTTTVAPPATATTTSGSPGVMPTTPSGEVDANGIRRDKIRLDEVAGRLRSLTVASVKLMPSSVPSNWTVELWTYPGGYSLHYADPSGTKTLILEISAPSTASGSQVIGTVESFRGDPKASYFALDPTDPQAFRTLTWREPGVLAQPPSGTAAGAGIPYYLTTTGLPEADFRTMAGSLVAV